MRIAPRVYSVQMPALRIGIHVCNILSLAVSACSPAAAPAAVVVPELRIAGSAAGTALPSVATAPSNVASAPPSAPAAPSAASVAESSDGKLDAVCVVALERVRRCLAKNMGKQAAESFMQSGTRALASSSATEQVVRCKQLQSSLSVQYPKCR
jgi:hypothetical protein